MAAALEANKIDGFSGNTVVLSMMSAQDPLLYVLDEPIESYDCGIVLAKNARGEALRKEINVWLSDMRESGELDRILEKWTEGPESERTIPDYESFPATKGVLTMATEGTYQPWNYYRGDEIVGMEVDLAALFCEANGYGLDIDTMTFDSLLMAIHVNGIEAVKTAASFIAQI